MPGRVLIVGGTGGIGSATARLLHDQGYQLHLVGRSEEKLVPLAQQLGAGYTRGEIEEDDFFSRVGRDAGAPLDGLVYAVGTIKLAGLAQLTESDLANDMRLNAIGAALAVQAALPALRRSGSGASVVLFSSVAAQQGFSAHSSISMAKGAVAGLTLALAAELAPSIRVNAIAPSLTRTPLARGVLSSETVAASLAGQHPLQRLGAPEDIAALTAFLLSSNASWITGQILGVDGGRSTLRTKG